MLHLARLHHPDRLEFKTTRLDDLTTPPKQASDRIANANAPSAAARWFGVPTSSAPTDPSVTKAFAQTWAQARLAPGLLAFAPASSVAPATSTSAASASAARPDIQRALDAITVRTTQRPIPGKAPNFLDLNEIASANTPAKREAFKALRVALKAQSSASSKVDDAKQAVSAAQLDANKAEFAVQASLVDLAHAQSNVDDAKTELSNADSAEERSAAQRALQSADRELRSAKSKLDTNSRILTKAETKLATAEKTLVNRERALQKAEQGVDKAAKALEKWVKDNGLGANRELRVLDRQIKKQTALVARLRAQGAPADKIESAEGMLDFLHQQKSDLRNYLQGRIDSFDALTDITQNHHTIGVDGQSVRLHDNVMTYATDTPEGLEGGAPGDDHATVTAALSQANISQDKRDILGIVSNHEGSFSTINSWDRAKVTFGFLQWTAGEKGDGSVVNLLADIKRGEPQVFADRFAKYGIDVKNGTLQLTQADGTVLRGRAAASAMQKSPKLMAALSASGRDPAVQQSQIENGARTKIDDMRHKQRSYGGQSVRIGSVLSSDYGVGLMADRAVHSGPGAVQQMFDGAMRRFLSDHPEADLNRPEWLERAEAYVIDDLEARDPQRARSFRNLDHAHSSFVP